MTVATVVAIAVLSGTAGACFGWLLFGHRASPPKTPAPAPASDGFNVTLRNGKIESLHAESYDALMDELRDSLPSVQALVDSYDQAEAGQSAADDPPPPPPPFRSEGY